MTNFTHIFHIQNLIGSDTSLLDVTHTQREVGGGGGALRVCRAPPGQILLSTWVCPVARLPPVPLLLPSPFGPQAATWLRMLQRHTKSNPHRKLCLLLLLYKCMTDGEGSTEMFLFFSLVVGCYEKHFFSQHFLENSTAIVRSNRETALIRTDLDLI